MSLVLVTGAGGFIGRHLASHLSELKVDVVGIGHGCKTERELASIGLADWLESDLSMQGLEAVYRKNGKPDMVFHLAGGSSVGAAFANPLEDFSRTVASTSVLLEWMRKRAPDAQLVAVSSAAVYGSGHESKISEQAALAPFSPYGAHKLMMEVLCRSYASNFGLKVITPRLFSVYGVELKKQLLWELCNRILKKPDIELGGSGNELRDWTHVNDVARILAGAADLATDKAPVLNVATGIATPVKEIAMVVAKQWRDIPIKPEIKFTGEAREGDPFSLVADTSFMSNLGFECRHPLEDGIAEYVAWFRQFHNAKGLSSH